MSSYIHFFVRNKEEFIPIGVYIRSTNIYKIFEVCAPYGKIQALSRETLKAMREDANDLGMAAYRDMKAVEKKITAIHSFNNPLNEKLEVIGELQEEWAEYKDDYNEYAEAYKFAQFLLNIVVAQCYAAGGEDFQADKCIYAGVECASVPSVQDIA